MADSDLPAEEAEQTALLVGARGRLDVRTERTRCPEHVVYGKHPLVQSMHLVGVEVLVLTCCQRQVPGMDDEISVGVDEVLDHVACGPALARPAGFDQRSSGTAAMRSSMAATSSR